jgi:hypothetical protein
MTLDVGSLGKHEQAFSLINAGNAVKMIFYTADSPPE